MKNVWRNRVMQSSRVIILKIIKHISVTGIISHSLQFSWILCTNLLNCIAIGQFGYGNVIWTIQMILSCGTHAARKFAQVTALQGSKFIMFHGISSKKQDTKDQFVFCYLHLPIKSERLFNTFFFFEFNVNHS